MKQPRCWWVYLPKKSNLPKDHLSFLLQQKVYIETVSWSSIIRGSICGNSCFVDFFRSNRVIYILFLTTLDAKQLWNWSEINKPVYILWDGSWWECDHDHHKKKENFIKYVRRRSRCSICSKMYLNALENHWFDGSDMRFIPFIARKVTCIFYC